MLQIHTILLPTDFSACADSAFDTAIDLAVRTGATVHLVHVWPGRSTSDEAAFRGGGPARDVAVRLREALVAHLGRLEPEVRNELEVRHVLVHGDHPAEAILEYAEEYAIDLVVLGTHGRRGLRRWLLGSVAEEVVRQATCPVLTVREGATAYPAFKHILTPIDFSDASTKALTQARHLAALYDAPLTLLFVAEERVVPTFNDTGLPTFTLLRPDPEIVGRAEEALQQLNEKILAPDAEIDCVVEHGHPHRSIVGVAEEHGTDLIVMATHGLGRQGHGLLGSVTERVVRTAPCPVWTLYVPPEATPTPEGEATYQAATS